MATLTYPASAQPSTATVVLTQSAPLLYHPPMNLNTLVGGVYLAPPASTGDSPPTSLEYHWS